MWSTFFHDGGWGMYPTSVFGFLLMGAVGLSLLRPERRWIPLVASLAVATFGAGLLGTSVGIVKSFHYLPEVPKADQLTIATLGCAESLNNLVLALIIVVLASLLASLAALRAGFASPAGERTK